MKNASLFAFIICIITVSSFAENESSYIIASKGIRTTSVYLSKNADYVSMSLTIRSKQKDSKTNLKEIMRSEQLIINSAKHNPDIKIHKGSILVSPVSVSKSFYSSYSSNLQSATQLHVMTKLDKKKDIYACSLRIKNFVDSIKLPGKSSITPGQIQLAVANPGQYRHDLLKKIFEDIVFTRSIMRSVGKVSVTGLESPVLVRQLGDGKVEMFINYSMTMEMSQKTTDAKN